MAEQIADPGAAELEQLLGGEQYRMWTAVRGLIEGHYEMETQWKRGGRAWTYEYKYRRGGRTLCALYARPGEMGVMIVFGREERAKFETARDAFGAAVRAVYDQAILYPEGKWLMLLPRDGALLADIERLLLIKRKPNRKG